jgi:4-diphosphocytidyl-2-C-methyl-D-erythritol kinase
VQIVEAAPAKVNLCLHVTGRRDDGYHLLDSLVVFAPGAADRIIARPGPLSLSIDGPFGAGLQADGDNLVLRAAGLMGQGAALHLHKALPLASGIGGGSADAAATLRAVARLTGMPLPPAQDVLRLGADVPVCLAGRPARMRGIGEVLDPVGAVPVHMVLVNPGVAVPTPAVFRALASRANPPLPHIPAFADAGAVLDWLTHTRNDLEPAAITVAPAIADVLTALRGAGAALARMSGSGATCFGLWPDAEGAGRGAAMLARRHPGWWVQAA